MKQPRSLSKDQIKELIDGGTTSNVYFAQKFGVRPALIATYKTRLRKAGFKIPYVDLTQLESIQKDIESLKEEVATS